jgi:hypothetical protein
VRPEEYPGASLIKLSSSSLTMTKGKEETFNELRERLGKSGEWDK